MTLPRITQPTCTTLDSGANTGWAFWLKYNTGWRLEACGLYLCTKDKHPPHHVIPCGEAVVVEVPAAQPRDTLKRTNDLFRTTQRGALVAGYLRPEVVHFVTPHEWKGGVPKEQHQPRIWGRLTDEEKALISRVGKLDDVLDAIGLGLVVLGRW
jgi:hypothetical protein